MLRSRPDLDQALYEQVKERDVRTNYSLECRLANQIVRGEELRRRLALLTYQLDQNLHDMWQACRWADRITLCEQRLTRDKEEIRHLWQALWQRVAQEIVEGAEIPPLDLFFFWAKPYLETVLSGDLSFAELDAGYDWENARFRPDFETKQ